MTPNEKKKLYLEIENCLRNSSVAASLPKSWESQLFSKHLEHLERSPQICTTITMELGPDFGWFTLEQAGGGFLAHIWAPGAREWNEAKEEAQNLSNCLSSVLPITSIKIRYAKPHEFLFHKGWPVHNGAGV